MTALHFAVVQNKPEVVKLLLAQKNIDINAKNEIHDKFLIQLNKKNLNDFIIVFWWKTPVELANDEIKALFK